MCSVFFTCKNFTWNCLLITKLLHFSAVDSFLNFKLWSFFYSKLNFFMFSIVKIKLLVLWNKNPFQLLRFYFSNLYFKTILLIFKVLISFYKNVVFFLVVPATICSTELFLCLNTFSIFSSSGFIFQRIVYILSSLYSNQTTELQKEQRAKGFLHPCLPSIPRIHWSICYLFFNLQLL